VRVLCNDLKSDINDPLVWNRDNDHIDGILDNSKYKGIKNDIISIFRDILIQGYGMTASEERATIVKEILTNSGYRATVVYSGITDR
jgi:hypothetical protein